MPIRQSVKTSAEVEEAKVEDSKQELTIPVDPHTERLRILTEKLKKRLIEEMNAEGSGNILQAWIRTED